MGGEGRVSELGERLRAARSAANLTQNAVAASLGMARTTLVAIEKGLRSVTAEELLALARLYDVSVGRITSPDAIHVDLSAKFRRTGGKEASKFVTESLVLLNGPGHWSGLAGAVAWPGVAHRLSAPNPHQPSVREPTG
jgi:transcriptional regulator with XRE-family HTH domain